MNTQPTPETEKLYKLAIYHLPYDTNNRANYQVWHTVGLLKSHMERFERERDEARGQRDRLAKALRECREDSVELLGERDWWQHEPRGDYQQRYRETRHNAKRADAALQSLTLNQS